MQHIITHSLSLSLSDFFLSLRIKEKEDLSMEQQSGIHNRSSATSSCSTTASNKTPPPAVPITRSEPNSPYPTTFVQADTSSFKQVVQMLTGSAETARHPGRNDPARNAIPPVKTRKEKPGSKLYERRFGLKSFKISPLGPGMVNIRQGLVSGYSGSPRTGTPEILSPSILDFPSLALSPVTPLIPDPFNREPAASSDLDMVAEDKAINEKGFYFHPSPANTPRESEPRLLPLFPVTSPRVAGSSTAADL